MIKALQMYWEGSYSVESHQKTPTWRDRVYKRQKRRRTKPNTNCSEGKLLICLEKLKRQEESEIEKETKPIDLEQILTKKDVFETLRVM